ncbi:uncharacterized protein LACBIDRAFT_335922 [Laccaria bicolor S238N-H82]|uniref:Predicted protein n=1 Tax=Laccaria bicolor (strain S238N-H82 / ATCC MYA-4686) TaxID=486041 RepID=B0E3U7_LACBS|nr:uncharacterized protein LACBIDRAFT_335922 [Laccaria bicolor S238N-H82]EDQ98481.1 predicted protein [Laccaria bicolor S238N-H82]|eukprot:XP_001890866.1 predicted protein [Laccaria bicolor S238N-H82]
MSPLRRISLRFLNSFCTIQFLRSRCVWLSICLNLECEYGFADVPALFFEVTNIAPYMTELGSISSRSYVTVITYTVLAWVIFISLMLEVLIWVGCMAFYITQHVWSTTTPHFLGQKVSQPHKVLFGHAAWRRHFSGETKIIQLSRGLLATTFILILLFSLVVNVFLDPIQETGITPTKDIRSLSSSLLPSASDTCSWSVVLVTPHYPRRSDPEDFSSMINVTPLPRSKGFKIVFCSESSVMQ